MVAGLAYSAAKGAYGLYQGYQALNSARRGLPSQSRRQAMRSNPRAQSRTARGLTQAAQRFGRPSFVDRRGLRTFKGAGMAEGHSITKDAFVASKKKKPDPALSVALPQVKRFISQNLTNSAEGFQAFTNLATLWTQTDLTNVIAQSLVSESRFFCQGGSLKSVITNLTSTPVNLVIYDWKCKDDLVAGSDPAATITNSLSAKYNTANQQNFPWMNPSEAKEFTANYKVLNTKEMVLSPGEVHIHDFYVKIEKYYDNSRTVNIAQPAYVRNYTHGTMIRQLGTPVTDDTKVSYAQTRLAYICHYKYDWKEPQGHTGPTLLANQTGAPQTGLATEKFMEEETGVATANTVA